MEQHFVIADAEREALRQQLLNGLVDDSVMMELLDISKPTLDRRAGPGGELIVAERVEIRPVGQIGQCSIVGDHDVARLHPWDVELVGRAEFAERE